jgi:ABC-type methionine transport system permease subunit
VPGVDHDLDPGPFLKLVPSKNPAGIYRLQHLFAFPLYAFTRGVWVFKKDFVQVFDLSMTGRPASKSGAASMVLGKLVHVSVFVLLPMLVTAYAWWQVLIGYVVMLGTIGFMPALIALSAYALLPIVRNTHAGLQSVAPGLIEAGIALGLRRTQILRLVELPLAAPMVLAGLKTAAVINVGTATVAAFVGAGGLGERIVSGLAVSDTTVDTSVLQG